MSPGVGPPLRQVIPFGRPLPALLDCVPIKMWSIPTSGFHTTSWTLVLAAAANPTTGSRDALATLCQIYWQPVYAFVRRNGHDPDQAQDLVQGFFAVLLEKHYLLDARQSRGRFRSFLLTAVKHFLANEWDRSRALGTALHTRDGDALHARTARHRDACWSARICLLCASTARRRESSTEASMKSTGPPLRARRWPARSRSAAPRRSPSA